MEGVSVLGGVRTFYRGNARKRLTPVVRARVASWVITRKFDPPPLILNNLRWLSNPEHERRNKALYYPAPLTSGEWESGPEHVHIAHMYRRLR